MPQIVLGKAWKEGHVATHISPATFTGLVKGKHISGTDHRETNGIVNWITIELTNGAYISIDDNGAEGVLCTYVMTPNV
jgi:hypothetical protein